MQHESQPIDMESPAQLQAATVLDAGITNRLLGQEAIAQSAPPQGAIAALPNLTPQEIDLAAFANNLLSVAQTIQPDKGFLVYSEELLKQFALREYIARHGVPPQNLLNFDRVKSEE